MSALQQSARWLLALIALGLAPLELANAQQVSVTAANPSSAEQGTIALDVEVTGSGFNSSAAVKFLVTGTTNTGGVTVRKVTVTGSKKLIATIDVAEDAVVSQFDIEVTLSTGRKGKGTTLFAVQTKGKPTTSDACVTPNVVTEATFPAFVFTKTIETSPNVYATGTFLADATGKCERLIGTWPEEVAFRYNPVANLALVLATSGNYIVVGLSSVSFGAGGPVATPLSGPTPILDTTQIPVPPDLASTGLKYGAAIDRVSSNGSELLFKIGLVTDSGVAADVGKSIVTCSLSYDVDSTIMPIDPATCREVHRYAPTANWHEIAFWGALPGTIYTTHPSSVDPMLNSLYRVTVQPPPAPSVVEELFYTGGILMGARATLAPPGSAVTNGEIVAVFEYVPGNIGTRCSKAIVIDAYNCTALSCATLNQKGLRSITWLPDGRLAGRGQTPPKKGNGTCMEDESFVAYPAIDSTNTAPTVLTTTPSLPYNLCRTCIEGSGGGW